MTTLTVDTMTSEQFEKYNTKLNAESNKFGMWFRGNGEDLKVVALEDKEQLDKLELTYEKVANRIDELFKKHKIGQRVEDRYTLCEILMRYQNCPFVNKDDSDGCENVVKDRGTVYLIYDNLTNKTLLVPSIWPHFIREHHCFGGKESAFRLNPATANEVFFVNKETHDTIKKLASLKV